ncbi:MULTISPECIES: PDZ domain-containing protein [unclassified Novosphingobium]|uniref:PDZ domain-containing protein n=1 Tax=unclassified Novosphingobium TaxID=2644732 RepID=UPI00135B6C47|nr:MULTISPECIES: PDZ domain-containing protein [unclassified Novosphingobium]
MRDEYAGPSPMQRRLVRLAPLLLLLVPAATMLFSVSHTGRTWFASFAGRFEARPLLPGMTIESAPWEPDRLVVTSIRSGSEAELKGITVGDTVLDMNGRPIFTLDQAARYLQQGTVVRLSVSHQGRPRTILLGRKGA